MTKQNEPATREGIHPDGTDAIRLVAYQCDGESLDYFIDNVRPSLVNYSEIELLALAGAFVDQPPFEIASFIAFYAASLPAVDSPLDDPARQSPVGARKSNIPNPDPAAVWEDWRASQRSLERLVKDRSAASPDFHWFDRPDRPN
jgi:hypothetical protein